MSACMHCCVPQVRLRFRRVRKRSDVPAPPTPITQDGVELLLMLCILLNWRRRRHLSTLSAAMPATTRSGSSTSPTSPHSSPAAMSRLEADEALLPADYVASYSARAVDAVWEGLRCEDVDFADQRTLEHFLVALYVGWGVLVVALPPTHVCWLLRFLQPMYVGCSFVPLFTLCLSFCVSFFLCVSLCCCCCHRM